jgi:hypothetical protein
MPTARESSTTAPTPTPTPAPIAVVLRGEPPEGASEDCVGELLAGVLIVNEVEADEVEADDAAIEDITTDDRATEDVEAVVVLPGATSVVKTLAIPRSTIADALLQQFPLFRQQQYLPTPEPEHPFKPCPCVASSALMQNLGHLGSCHVASVQLPW